MFLNYFSCPKKSKNTFLKILTQDFINHASEDLSVFLLHVFFGETGPEVALNLARGSLSRRAKFQSTSCGEKRESGEKKF